MIVNAHSDYALYAYREKSLFSRDILNTEYLQKLRSGKITIEILQTACDFLNWQGNNWNDPMTVYNTLDFILNSITQSKGKINLITSKLDLDTIKQANSIGFLLSIEGCASIDPQFHALHNYYRLGVRSIALTHNFQNIYAIGCGENKQGGLSRIGKKLIEEISSLPIILDLSHVNEQTFFDSLEIYQKPPIVSHSNTIMECLHFRNLSDGQILAVGERKGVIGVNFMSELIDVNKNAATIDRLIDHIDYIEKLIGIDHIGLGPDFTDYFTPELQEIYPDGIKTIEQLPNVSEHLSQRGYSKIEIDKIMGENFFRIFSEVL